MLFCIPQAERDKAQGTLNQEVASHNSTQMQLTLVQHRLKEAALRSGHPYLARPAAVGSPSHSQAMQGSRREVLLKTLEVCVVALAGCVLLATSAWCIRMHRAWQGLNKKAGKEATAGPTGKAAKHTCMSLRCVNTTKCGMALF